ncbi:MAG: hypothetical protein WA431_02875 [Candidatus Cybelea sp.]
MRTVRVAGVFLSGGLAVLSLAGCGGTAAGTGGLPAAMRSANTRGERAARGDLLYVESNGSGQSVDILTYPGGNLVKEISGIGPVDGMCADTSGNVWVIVLDDTVYEFSHGGTSPIAQVTVPDTSLATGCAVDPKAGDLAVINYGGPYGSSVDVWSRYQGSPTIYPTSFKPWAVTYDGSGDLFADGSTGNSSNLFVLGELASGQSAFQPIQLDKVADWPGGLQWDGKHLVLGTGGRSLTQRTYQIAVSGSSATVVRTLHFGHMAKQPYMTWIHDDTIISEEGEHHGFQLAFWRYPKHGKPYKVLSDYSGRGVVSVAPAAR